MRSALIAALGSVRRGRGRTADPVQPGHFEEGAATAPDGEIERPGAPLDDTDATFGERSAVAELIDDRGRQSAAIAAPPRRHGFPSKPSATVAVSLSIVTALIGLTGWLGYRALDARQAQEQRALFVQVGRQGALDLTTISDSEAESDMKRILASSTGAFYDQVETRSQEFVTLVQQAHTKSMGTIAEAGVESEQGQQAQVLVAVNVKSSDVEASSPRARTWRMRITVQQVDGGAKISNVEFVP
jgi:Mce-associated membrane protein